MRPSLVRLATLFAVLAAAAGASTARAQGIDCRYFKISVDRVSAFEEPRGDAKFIATIDKDHIVCVAGDQEIGGHMWAFIPYQLEPRNQHKSIQGWAMKDSLVPASQEEVAAISESRESAQPPPAAFAPPPGEMPRAELPRPEPPRAESPRAEPPRAEERATAAPGEEVVRFSRPITSGGYPVQGNSLEQLIHGVPTFPPIEGLPDNVWHKTCNDCHNWNQQTLCQQAMIYAQDVKMTMRKQHPYGGPEKLAMRNWAQHGCQ
jgi:hypothetical protein